MSNVIVTGPCAEPIQLAEAKAHLRVTGTDDDAYVTGLIRAAREFAETWTRRSLVVQTRREYLDRLYGEIRLPAPPLVAVDAITYVDGAGVTQTITASDYVVDAYAEPGRVYPAYAKWWPSTRGDANGVIVTYKAGYALPFTAVAATDICTGKGRNLMDGTCVRLSNSGGALPAGLAANTDYYVVSASGATFKLAAMAGGAAIDITDTGTGTHFVGVVPRPILQAILFLIGQWYGNREAVAAGQAPTVVPLAVDSLLWSSRMW